MDSRKRSYLLEVELPHVMLADLLPDEKKLLQAANAVFQRPRSAYAPYSRYRVSAAVLGEDGEIYTGVNEEEVTYTGTVHAEMLAIAKMVEVGCRQWNKLVVISDGNGVPCKLCQQRMREFAGDPLSLDELIVLGADVKDLDNILRTTFGQIIGVDSFNPSHLGINPNDF